MSLTRRQNFDCLLALILGHFLVDMAGGMLPPLIPAMQRRYGMNLLQVTTLLMAFSIGANVGQPLFGYLGDRNERLRRFLPPMVVVAFLPMFMGFVASRGALALLLLGGGIGLAYFHPNGVREVQALPGSARGARMAAFLGIGFAGFAVGSLGGAVVSEEMGIEWVWLPIVPAAFVAAALARVRRHTAPLHGVRVARGAVVHERGYSFPLIWATGLLIALTSGTLMKLMPKYSEVLTGSTVPGSAAVMFYGLGGGLIGLALGAASDRAPRGYVCAGALAATSVFLGIFFLGGGEKFLWFSLAGCGIGASFPVLVAMSHEARGRESNLRNGLMVGACWGLSSLLLPVVGAAADRWGLPRVLPWFALLPPVVAVLFVVIERRNGAGRQARPSVPAEAVV